MRLDAQERDQVGDVLLGELIAERRHRFAAIVDLGSDGGGFEMVAHLGEIRPALRPDPRCAVAMDAAGGGKELSATAGGV